MAQASTSMLGFPHSDMEIGLFRGSDTVLGVLMMGILLGGPIWGSLLFAKAPCLSESKKQRNAG